jgi:hypothetical protein
LPTGAIGYEQQQQPTGANANDVANDAANQRFDWKWNDAKLLKFNCSLPLLSSSVWRYYDERSASLHHTKADTDIGHCVMAVHSRGVRRLRFNVRVRSSTWYLRFEI